MEEILCNKTTQFVFQAEDVLTSSLPQKCCFAKMLNTAQRQSIYKEVSKADISIVQKFKISSKQHIEFPKLIEDLTFGQKCFTLIAREWLRFSYLIVKSSFFCFVFMSEL